MTRPLTTHGAILGSFAEVRHVFSQKTVNEFANICGDNNPLHSDPVFAAGTRFKGTIVHGILVSSLFSTIFGRSFSGAVYVSQSLRFKRPVHVGVEIVARVEVVHVESKKNGQRLITCSTTCLVASPSSSSSPFNSSQETSPSVLVVAVEGEAKVLLPNA